MLGCWISDQATARSLSALLNICTHEVLGVFLKDVVNLVEQIVRVLGQLFATLLACGGAAGEVIVISTTTAAFGLLLRHRRLLLCHEPRGECPFARDFSLPYRSAPTFRR